MESTLLSQELLPQTYTQIDSAYYGPITDIGFVLPAPETPLKPIQVTTPLKSRLLKWPSSIRWLLNKLKRSPAKKGKRARLISLDDLVANPNVTDDENMLSTNTLDIVVPLEVKKRTSWTSAVSTFIHLNPRTSTSSSNQQDAPVTQKAYKLENFVPILLVKGVDNSNFSLDGFKFKHVRIDETTIYIGKKKEILLKDCCVRPAMTTSSPQDCVEIITNAAIKGQRGRRNQGTRLLLVLRDFGQLEKWRDGITDLIQSALVTDLSASRVDGDHEKVQEEELAVVAKSEVSSDQGMEAEKTQENSQFEKVAEPMELAAATAKSIMKGRIASHHVEDEAAVAKSLKDVWLHEAQCREILSRLN